MDALRLSYGGNSSDSDSESDLGSDRIVATKSCNLPEPTQSVTLLPPPPISLLHPPNSLCAFDYSLERDQPNRLRSFPHVEGNFALHVYIPVIIPDIPRKELSRVLKSVVRVMPELHVLDLDIPLSNLLLDDNKFEQVALGREFHISLGRTVPIRVHQRDSMVAMLRQRLQSHRRFWIDFTKWEVFVNDEGTRTFLSLEVTARGLAQIKKQIESVNDVYKLHNLPEFYKDPCPHISIAWAVGNLSAPLQRAIGEAMKTCATIGGVSPKCFYACMCRGILCKIGNKTYDICKVI